VTHRQVAAALALQVHGGMDPDGSRNLADRFLRAADRAAARGHTDSGPTQTEVARATSELARQGVTASPAQVERALLAALVPEMFAKAS
jgi:hypothetical protein